MEENIQNSVIEGKDPVTGKFKKGNKLAKRAKRVKVETNSSALNDILTEADGNALQAAIEMLKNKDKLNIPVQQVIKLIELIAPYQAAKKKEELDQDFKIKLNILHTNE